MWVPAGLVPLLAFTAIFFRWAASEADDEIGVGGGQRGSPGTGRHDGRSARALL
jgi:hypothetical protein